MKQIFAEVTYKAAKKQAKQPVWHAKQEAGKAMYANVDPNGPEIHCTAKQMRRQNQGVRGKMLV